MARRLLRHEAMPYLGGAMVICFCPALPLLLRSHTASEHHGATYGVTRFVFLRLLGATYVVAFASLYPQLRGLYGEHGLMPVQEYLHAAEQTWGRERYWYVPSLAWLKRDDSFLQQLCGAGILLSLAATVDLCPLPALIGAWICFQSLVSVGRPFLPFQWDVLLVETGFIAFFFAPPTLRPGSSLNRAPSRITLWLLRWLLFRLIFMSGAVKLRSGDATWQGLTALGYHFQTQPLPTPAAWYMQRVPQPFLRLAAAISLVIELVGPFLIFAPRRARLYGAGLQAGLQAIIMFTGNYGFFNILTMVLCVAQLDDAALAYCVPARLRALLPRQGQPGRRMLSTVVEVPAMGLLLLTSIAHLAETVGADIRLPAWLETPLRRIEALKLVNRYGLFAVMTTTRPEVIIEGSNDGTTWQEYTFPAKAGDIMQPPRWIAPHQPRLDWQLWFAALSSAQRNPWFITLLVRLLEGRPEVVSLLATNPFPQAPPRYIRALLYDYRFADPATHHQTGAWWQRDLLGSYMPTIALQ